MDKFTGADLIALGFPPAPWFKDAIARGNELLLQGLSRGEVEAAVSAMAPPTVSHLELRTNSKLFGVFLDTRTDEERENVASVVKVMDEIMRVPVVERGAVMPDACPTGPNSIPVGSVVASQGIHPGFHSSDVCCSVMISVFKRRDDPKRVMDELQRTTHFGPGGRRDSLTSIDTIWRKWSGDNPFLSGLETVAQTHLGTQGDGNHFAFLGHLRSTGQMALVTHHGSRGLGAQVYKRGVRAAVRHKNIHAPRLSDSVAWIDPHSREGEDYWDALQVVRRWTRLNHSVIHDSLARRIGNAVDHRFWNEHNFVFRKSDGLFYHGKGATPSWRGFSEDDSGQALIPLNMSEPVLVVEPTANSESLEFAPHGAGRNLGRKRFLRENPEWSLPEGIDVRFYCGHPDPSELPAAYKDAGSVTEQIERFDLARIVDHVDPYGSIMAGEWDRDAPWKKRRTP